MAGPGEVVLQVKAALTCGTDLKTYRRGHPVMIQKAPTVFGHEFAGVIAELGPGVEAFTVGQRAPERPQFRRECPVSSPPLVVGALDAAARLGHHRCHRIAPSLVVGCLLVLSRS